jgi:uncharacterized protein
MEIESWVFYNSWWDMLMMFFLGIAMFRSGFLLGKKSTGVYAIVAVAGIAIGLALNYFYLGTAYRLRFDEYKWVQRISFAAYDVRRLCQTTGYLSLLILLYRVGFFKKLLGIFAPVGQMAFTNYLSQSIITSIIFHGFHLFDTLQRYQVYYVVVSIWVFQIIFSNIWLRYFRFGPFEWVWRALTYRTRPPMLRKAELEVS